MRPVLAIAVVVASGLLVPTTATAATDTAATGTASSGTVLELDEQSTGFDYSDGGDPGPSVGDVLKLTTAITGAAVGDKKATCTTFAKTAEGHLIARCEEHIHLSAGDVDAYGLVDQTSLPSGQVQTLGVVGRSGAYRGRLGLERYHATHYPVSFHTKISLR